MVALRGPNDGKIVKSVPGFSAACASLFFGQAQPVITLAMSPERGEHERPHDERRYA
jgi:hypothetical protein